MIGTIILIAHISATILSCGILCLAIVKRNSPKSLYFSFLSLAMFLYTVGYTMEITSTSRMAAYTAIRIEYLGLPFIAPFAFMFIMDFCNKPIKKKRYLIALLIVPIMVCLLANTWTYNGILFGDLVFVTIPAPHLAITPSIIYSFAFLYAGIILSAGIGYMIYTYIRADAMFRVQARFLFIGAALPLTSSTLTFLGIVPFGFDMTNIMLSITSLILALSIFKLGLLDLMPYAKESILENLNDAFLLLDVEGYILDYNHASEIIFPQLIDIKDNAHINNVPDMPSALSSHTANSQDFSLQIDGQIKHFRTSNSKVMYQNKLVCICIMIYDVTEIKLLMQELNELATYDSLTHLYNRGSFFRLAKHELEIAKVKEIPTAVMMMDIDYFKLVNDTYGHICGDDVLKTVAGKLQGHFRSSDIYARYGGEELCAYLSNTVAEHAFIVAERLRKTIEDTDFEYEGETFNITMSIGIGVYDKSKHENLEALLLSADQALYKAKHKGRNMVYMEKMNQQDESASRFNYHK